MLVMISALAILTVAAGTFNLQDELEGAMDTGASNDWLNIWSASSDESESYRGPSEASYADDSADTGDILTDEGDTTPAGESDNPAEEDPFSDGIDASFYSFYEDKINAAQQSGTVTIDEIVGFFALPNGSYPDNYLVYEETDLLPWCQIRGGVNVFSISINNDTSRQFYCVKNL
jgi:hypothetical protein